MSHSPYGRPPSPRIRRLSRANRREATAKLVVLKKAPSREAMRLFWNLKEGNVLDPTAVQGRLWIGRTFAGVAFA